MPTRPTRPNIQPSAKPELSQSSHTIHITAEAFRAINLRRRPGPIRAEATLHPDGSASIKISPEVLARLESLRGPGETISSVILQLCAPGAQSTVQ